MHSDTPTLDGRVNARTADGSGTRQLFAQWPAARGDANAACER
jgi:hypothetical protein